MKLNNKSNEILFLLFGADLLFIILHFLHTYTPYFSDAHFSAFKDRGFAEIFQYVKEYWIVLVFAWLSILKSTRSYLAWSLLFGYLLLDDSFQIHERLGTIAANYLNYQTVYNLRAQDFGELTVNMTVGLVLLLAISGAYYWGKKDFRRDSQTIILMLVALAIFGVGVDLIHVMIGKIAGKSSFFYEAIGVIEDGGEMLVLSAICWYSMNVLREERSVSDRISLTVLATEPALSKSFMSDLLRESAILELKSSEKAYANFGQGIEKNENEVDALVS